MKKLLLFLTVALLYLTPSADAAISVAGSGVGPLTFDTPPLPTEFATDVFLGDGNRFNNVGQIDAAVAGLDASTITRTMINSGTIPPSTSSTGFRVNTNATTGHFIQSRPTTDLTNAANILLARLQNDSGAPITSCDVSYDMATFSPPAGAQENLGWQVYYSDTGAPGSWTKIGSLSDVESGALSGTLAFATPVAVGATFYILWVDDNAINVTDSSYTMDNFTIFNVVGAADTTLTLDTQPTPQTVNEGQTATFTVTVSGSGAKYHWFKEGNATPIAGATGPTLRITNCMSANVGNYYVTVTNSLSSLESTPHVHLAVIADLTRPTLVRAILSNDLTSVLISFSKPVFSTMAGEGAQDPINYIIFITDPQTDGLATDSVAFQPGSNQTNVVLTIAGGATAGVNYKLEIGRFGEVTDTAENRNLLIPLPTPAVINVMSFAPIMTFSGQNWRYKDDAIEQPADWFTTSFDDSSWPQGLSLFDNVIGGGNTNRTTNGSGMIFLLLTNEVHVVLPLTNSIFPDPNAKIPTYYFRTHFIFPADPAGAFLVLRTEVDDGVVIYLNGAEAFRQRVTNNAFAFYGGSTANGNGAIEGPFFLSTTNVHKGDNVIAVLLKQGSTNSSDITFGLELECLTPVVLQILKIAPDGSGGAMLTWTDGSALLQVTTVLNSDPTLTSWGPVGGAPLGSTSYAAPPLGAGETKKFYRLKK